MPADFPIGPARKPKRSPAKVAHAVRRSQKTTRPSTPAPRTDAQTSGRNYGVKRAQRFKKTRPYRQAVETAVRAQPAAKRAERVNQVAGRIRKGHYTGSTPIEDAVVVRRAARLERASRDPKKAAERQRKMDLQARYTHTGPARRAISTGQPKPSVLSQATFAALPGVSTIKDIPILGPAATGLLEATARDPIGVPAKTAKGAVDIAVATPAAIAQLVAGVGVPLATGHPGKAGSNAGKLLDEIAKDYARRYGPLLKGEAGRQEFIQRVREEGAAPEVLDASVALTGGGAVTGRALGVAARSGKLGGRLERVASAPRPELRVSANVSRPQTLSRNLFVATAQRGQDAARTRSLRRATTRAARNEAAGIDDARAFTPLQPEPGQVRPLFRTLERRNQRVDVSRTQSRSYIRQRREFDQEVARGTAREFTKLPKHEQDALFHTTQGLLPIGGTATQIRHAARARTRQIVGEREGRVVQQAMRASGSTATRAHDMARIVRRAREEGNGPATVDGLIADLKKAKASDLVIRTVQASADELREALREPKVLRNQSELAALRRIERNADKLAGSRTLQEFQQAHLERSRRLEQGDPAFDAFTAAARVYEPQGEAVGIPNPVREDRARVERQFKDGELDAEQRDAALAAIDKDAPERINEWIERVRTEAESRGLPEPAYLRHQPDLRMRRGDMTLGNITKAMRGTRRSQQELFRTGRASANPRLVVAGLATNIKRKHQWAAVDEVYQRHTFPWSRNKPIDGTGDTIMREVRRRGLDPDDVVVIDMGRYRAAAEAVNPDAEKFAHDPMLYETLRETMFSLGDSDGKELRALSSVENPKYKKTSGFSAIERGVADELLAATRPPNPLLRVAGKAQGIQSAAILGLNPSWLLMQVAANTLATTFGTRGAIGDLVKANPLYRQLSREQREMLDDIGGIGVLEAHTGQHLGRAVGGPAVEAARRMGQTKIGSALKQANPIRLMFLADNAQNRAFRRAVLTNGLKREAFQRIRKESGRMAESLARVEQLLKMKPTDSVMKQIRAVLENPADVEKLATHTNNVLGDFLRYTVRERRSLKTFVMFYGFLRYALRTAFYTMPVHHPVMSSIALKLGQLHVEEVKDLLGGDSAPWAYSRIYFEGKNGELKSIDLGRINPVTTPLTSVVSEGPKAFGGLVSPMAQTLADQVYGGVLWEGGRGFRVQGSAAENRNPGLGERGRIVLNQTLGAAFPYRFGSELTQQGRQGDDSLLFDERPIQYKTATARARNQQRVDRKGDFREQLLQQIIPLFVPKPDFTKDFVQGQGNAAPTPAAPSTAGMSNWEKQQLRKAITQAQQAPKMSNWEREQMRKALAAANGGG